jgi:hypothetical protein
MSKGRLLVVTAVVVVVVAAAVTTVVVTSSTGTPSAQNCDIPASVVEHPAPAAAAPGGGGIVVAEQGFSQANAVSIGAVLRNTSNQIAYRTKVAFRPFAATDSGPPKPLEGSLPTTEIPVIMPGQQVGVARGIQLGRGRIGRVDLDLHTTTWLPVGALGGFSPTATSFESLMRAVDRFGLPITAVRYTEGSANCRPLENRYTAVVFRDAGGAIVGGDLTVPDGRGRQIFGLQPPSSPSCSPGKRETWIAPMTGAPPNASDQRTELYSYCDLNAPPNDVNRPF